MSSTNRPDVTAGGGPERLTAEPRDAEGALGEMLRTLLETPELVPFAEAVIVHVQAASGSAALRPELVRDVVELLRAVEGDEEPLPTRALLESPDLLASFFQNADLLDSSAPETAGIARLVMAALELLDGELE